MRVVRVIRNNTFDGEPCELKGSCTVRGGGKDGDNIKVLPIAIFQPGGNDFILFPPLLDI